VVSGTAVMAAIVVGEWRDRPEQHSPRDGKMNILNEKLFFALKALLRQMEEDSLIRRYFLRDSCQERPLFSLALCVQNPAVPLLGRSVGNLEENND